jgi:Putative MetA-pathway of phenol degradation
MKAGFTLIWTLVLVLVAGSGAAKDPLITDRPDFTESAFVVGRGTVQLEGGATYGDFGAESATTLPELLVRWGITRRVELRFLTPTYAWLDGTDGSTSGFLNMALGAKIALNDGEGDGFWGRTGAALLVATTVPTGSSALSSDELQPTATLSLAWELSEAVGFGTNIGWARPEEDGRRFNTFFASVAAGVGVAKNTSVFFELVFFDRERDRGPSTSTFQTGVTYLVNPDFQLDLRVARRIGSEGADLLVGIGASARF